MTALEMIIMLITGCADHKKYINEFTVCLFYLRGQIWLFFLATKFYYKLLTNFFYIAGNSFAFFDGFSPSLFKIKSAHFLKRQFFTHLL